ncbi:MAG: PhzF family phenazine biosynthesis protein [Bacillota bacterium]
MPITYYLIDAFTATRFRGNPAAVCLMDSPIEDSVMQAIAAELNLSETAFLYRSDSGSPGYQIRWFTPQIEVSLCAHATLAASAVVFSELQANDESITYQSRSGQLVARRSTAGITLDFPADTWESMPAPPDMLTALGLETCLDTFYGQRTGKLIIRIDRPEHIRLIKPNFDAMLRVQSDRPIRGVAVTARAVDRYDFVSRYFNPWGGVNEDSVTGSVHTVLAPYWGELLAKQELMAYQASPRGGELRIRLLGEGRLEISGQTVMVGKGELFV